MRVGTQLSHFFTIQSAGIGKLKCVITSLGRGLYHTGLSTTALNMHKPGCALHM